MPPSSPPFGSLLSIPPPELEAIDEAWNEEAPTQDGVDSERVTQVPSIPPDQFAKKLMREASSETPASAGSDKDVFERPTLQRPVDISEAVTYRPPIASSLTPGSALFGAAPAPRPPQIELDDPQLELDTQPYAVPEWMLNEGSHSELPTDPCSEPELMTDPCSEPNLYTEPSLLSERTIPIEDDLEFEADTGRIALERAEREALLPARSGLDLARRLSSIPVGPRDPLQDMHDRYAMGDFSGALELAESILSSQPGNQEAVQCAQNCRDVLTDMYTSRLGGSHQRAIVVMSPDQIRWLSLDHRAGFLLSMIDGVSTVDELLDICGMSRLEALRILCSLLDQQAIIVES